MLAGGHYEKNDGSFYGLGDYDTSFTSRTINGFLCRFASWNADVVPTVTVLDGIKIYPNPATTQLNIRTEENSAPVFISVSDQLGRQVYKDNLNNSITIPINGWQKGVYYVRIVSDNNSSFIKEIVVE